MLYAAAPGRAARKFEMLREGLPEYGKKVPERGSARSSTAAAQAAQLACLLASALQAASFPG